MDTVDLASHLVNNYCFILPKYRNTQVIFNDIEEELEKLLKLDEFNYNDISDCRYKIEMILMGIKGEGGRTFNMRTIDFDIKLHNILNNWMIKNGKFCEDVSSDDCEESDEDSLVSDEEEIV